VKRQSERTAAVERGQWLADLAQAVDQAQRLARTLVVLKGSCAESEALYGRLEVVRIEVEDLRRGGWGARPMKIDPLWISLFSLERPSEILDAAEF